MFNKNLVTTKEHLKQISEAKKVYSTQAEKIKSNLDYSDKYKTEQLAQLQLETKGKITRYIEQAKSELQAWHASQLQKPFDLDFAFKITQLFDVMPGETVLQLVKPYRGNFTMIDTLIAIADRQEKQRNKVDPPKELDLSKMGNRIVDVLKIYSLSKESAGLPTEYYSLAEYIEKMESMLDEVAKDRKTENQALQYLNIAQIAEGGEAFPYFEQNNTFSMNLSNRVNNPVLTKYSNAVNTPINQ